MVYIGIDISKDEFHVCGMLAPKVVILNGYYSNDLKGFEIFQTVLQSSSQYETMETVVCMESTGVYGEKLCHFLHRAGFDVHVEPPQYVRRAFRLKRKTDRVDAQMIAEYAFRFRDQLHPWTPQNETLEQLRTLLNNREVFVRSKTAHKNMLKALKEKEMQELEHYHQEAIDYIQKTTKDIDDKLKAIVKTTDADIQTSFDMLLSIPGVGWQWAAWFFITSNGFHQLNYRKLAAYLGLVPYEYESGSSVYRNPKTDTSGPDQFRKLLYLSAISVCRVGKFQKYFQQKKAEGKNGKLVLNNIQNKLLKIACACVRDKKPYYEGHRSVNPLKS